MPLKIRVEGAVMTAALIGDIDHHAAKGMREEIDDTAQRLSPKLLSLDFKEVTFMDSSGIGLVMGRYKLMKSLGGDVSIVNVPPHIKRVMRLAGIERLAVTTVPDSNG